MKSKVLDRFLYYISYDTQSDDTTGTTPSTKKQLVLAKILAEELKAMDMDRVILDDYGYVYAVWNGTVGMEDLPALGFLAHMDTAPDALGVNIKAKVIENYDGGNILLNEEKQLYLSPEEYPTLCRYQEADLVVTDGTTLLGADDKAGIAEIMTALEEAKQEKLPHGPIYVAFTPDEEIGEGTDHINLDEFSPQYAYTIDGGELGELQYECFHAASAAVEFHGVNIHPGDAKDKMKNAALMGMEFHRMLPENEIPGHTQGYEGFYHLTKMEGAVESAKLHYIIRDHDRLLFDKRKAMMEQIAAKLNCRYGEDSVVLTITDSYYNMKEKILPHQEILEKAKNAFLSQGITPLIQPIRGGTDGARLSFMGIPTPNLSAGGHNFHGRFEYIPVQSMEAMVKVMKELMKGERDAFSD